MSAGDIDRESHWWDGRRKVSVVVDTEGWFDPFAVELVSSINALNDQAEFYRHATDVPPGEITFFLSCTRIVPPEILARSKLNLVVHASKLPEGRGFSPLVWQILEGKDVIPVSLIEAVDGVDEGNVFLVDEVRFEGHELNDAMRHRLGRAVNDLCLRFLRLPDIPSSIPQSGEPCWYPRRRPKDSELNADASISSQFNLLRVVDNERYPAFFNHRGRRFIIKVYDAGPT